MQSLHQIDFNDSVEKVQIPWICRKKILFQCITVKNDLSYFDFFYIFLFFEISQLNILWFREIFRVNTDILSQFSSSVPPEEGKITKLMNLVKVHWNIWRVHVTNFW